MPKTITLSKTKVKEILLAEVNGEFVIQAVYVFIDDKGEEYGMPKRATFKDLPNAFTNKMSVLFTLFDDKTKSLEKL